MMVSAKSKLLMQRLKSLSVGWIADIVKKTKDFLREIAFKGRIQFYRSEQRSNLMYLKFKNWSVYYFPWICVFAISALFFLSWLLSTKYKFVLLDYFSQHIGSYTQVQSLLITVGGALLGASAIAFSMVMFTMQVNIERLPQTLFQKISGDIRIKLAFLGTFVVAILTGSASLIPETTLAHRAILAIIWGPLFAVLMLLYAYRRALKLINPYEQLSELERIAQKDLDYWNKQATRGARRLKVLGYVEESGSDFDTARFHYFDSNRHWLNDIFVIVRNSLTIASHYNSKDDNETSARALEVVLSIHQRYIEVKGATFMSQSSLLDSSHCHDAFLTDTLERLRQWEDELFSRNDERAIYQLNRTLVKLCEVYLHAKYSRHHTTPSHALLVSHYLESVLKKACTTKLVDVVMDGQRSLSQCGRCFIFIGQSECISSQIKNITQAAMLGIASEEFRPTIQTGAKCLGELGVALLIGSGRHSDYVVSELNRAHVDLVKFMLEIPAQHNLFTNISMLTSYFDTLNEFYIDAFNNVIEGNVIRNQSEVFFIKLFKWADVVNSEYRHILLLAIKKKSQFALQLIFWLESLIKVLMAIASSEFVHDRAAVENRIVSLIRELNLPTDIESVKFTGSFSVESCLLELGDDAGRHELKSAYDKIDSLLWRWALEAGQHQCGWATLEKSLKALMMLAINSPYASIDVLIDRIGIAQEQNQLPERVYLDRTARELRRLSDDEFEKYGHDYLTQSIRHANHKAVREALRKIANKISPDTTDDLIKRVL